MYTILATASKFSLVDLVGELVVAAVVVVVDVVVALARKTVRGRLSE